MQLYKSKSNSVAIIRGIRKIEFGKFFKEIDRVAAGLFKMGVQQGDVVMSALPNIEQHAVLVYAVSRIGAILSVVHPLLTEKSFYDLYAAHKPKVLFLSDINLFKFGGLVECKSVYCPFFAYGYVGLPHARVYKPYDGDGSEIMFYMHSGGTTGVPKTVQLTSKAVNALTRNLYQSYGDDFGEKDAMLVTLPMFHGFGMCVGVHTSLSANMPIVLMPKFNCAGAVKLIKKHKVTNVISVPRMLVKFLKTEKFEGENIKSLKQIFVGGDYLSTELEQAFNKRLSEAGSSARVATGYGLTEVGSAVTLQYGEFRKGTVGRPLKNMECAIIDDDGNMLSDGEVGELILSGDQLMKGYLGDVKLTKEAMFEADNKIWLKTGDYFKKDSENYLTYMGRKKRLIKISGMSVFPTEIERVATELGFFTECVACDIKVKGKSYIYLFVEGSLTQSQKSEVIAAIKRSLSHWNMPSEIVCLDVLPRTNIGKIDFARLQNEYSKN